MCLQLGFVIFGKKEIGTKAAHQMLVKLATVGEKIDGEYVPSSVEMLDLNKIEYGKYFKKKLGYLDSFHHWM